MAVPTEPISPINAGSIVFNSFAGKGGIFVLGYVDLPTGDGVEINPPTQGSYVNPEGKEINYLMYEFNYPNEPDSNETISYPLPVKGIDTTKLSMPDELHIQNKSGGSKVIVKTAQPVGQGRMLEPLNSIKCHVLSNKPTQPEGAEANPTYYFLFTEILRGVGVVPQLIRNPDMEAQTLYYSLDGVATSDNDLEVSYDYVSNKQIIFTRICFMSGDEVVTTQELGGKPSDASPFSENTNYPISS